MSLLIVGYCGIFFLKLVYDLSDTTK